MIWQDLPLPRTIFRTSVSKIATAVDPEPPTAEMRTSSPLCPTQGDKVPAALLLEVEVRIAGTDFLGAAIRFEAGDFYGGAVNQAASSGPQAMPRGGTLVLWDQMMVAGRRPELP